MARIITLILDRFKPGRSNPIHLDSGDFLTPEGLLNSMAKAKIVNPKRVTRWKSQRVDLDTFASELLPENQKARIEGLKKYCEMSVENRKSIVLSKGMTAVEKLRWTLLEGRCAQSIQEKLNRLRMSLFWNVKSEWRCEEGRDFLFYEFRQAVQSLFHQNFKRSQSDLVPRVEDLIAESEILARQKKLAVIHQKIEKCSARITDDKIAKLVKEEAGSREILQTLIKN